MIIIFIIIVVIIIIILLMIIIINISIVIIIVMIMMIRKTGRTLLGKGQMGLALLGSLQIESCLTGEYFGYCR